MKKLRIAFLVSTFPTISETFIVNQISDLIDRGHEVKIFAFQQGNSSIVHEKIRSYALMEKTIFYQEQHVSKIKRFFPFLKFVITRNKVANFKRLVQNFHFRRDGIRAFNLHFYYKIKWILGEGDFDIFHAHFGSNGAYIAQLKELGFLSNTKLVATFHGYDLTPNLLPKYRIEYEDLFKEADLLTVNTEYTKSILKQITSEKKVEILPVGLDTSDFYPVKRSGDSFQLLFVGRLIPLKAPDLILEIIRKLIVKGHTNIKLTMVGDGELRGNINEYIRQYKLEPYVLLKGALSQEEVRDILNYTDVFVMPGIYDRNERAETQGLVIQEAQAMEVPVIVSDAGGMKYGVLDGETGFVVKEKDIEGFVKKIEILLTDKVMGKNMGKRGREFIVENYDSKVLGDQLEKLYLDIL